MPNAFVATAIDRAVSMNRSWLAVRAAESKQARDIIALDVRQATSFADYFVICSGTNSRQIQAIADAVDERLEALGLRVTHAEGYKQAEWVLLDYVDFVVHVFSEQARKFYDLERLWKSARRMAPEELKAGRTRTRIAATAAPRKKRA